MIRRDLFMNVFIACFLCISLPVSSQTKTPVAHGYGGAVATVNVLASKAALEILNSGGNAVDAAVAAASTLGVTDPFSCGIGGGGFMMIYLAKDKRVITIDHRETAPALASSVMFLENGDEMDFEKAKASGLSIGVPGTIRGWHEALSRFGTRSFADVLRPAIDIAERGFKIDENFHRINQANEKKFALFVPSQKLFLKNKKALPVGSHFNNPDLAKTYREIAKKGVRYFYEDKPAQAIIASVQKPPTVKGVSVKAGHMTMADLANYETRLRLPVHSSYRGYEIYGMNLPSSGGIAIAEALNILEGFDLSSMTRVKVEHLFLETSRLVFADRKDFLADPEYVLVPVNGLLNKNYAASRRKMISENATQKAPVLAGDPYAFDHDYGAIYSRKSTAASFSEESTHTTHLTVADSDGNIVAYTYTIEDWGGSGIVVPDYGFLLNNELTDFDFAKSKTNLPAPGKRPRSSMAPTLVLKDGQPVLALGSPGGSTIITTVLQILVNFIDLGMSIDEAVAAPRMSQRNGHETLVEPSYKKTDAAKSLLKLGHKWQHDANEIGAANAIYFGNNNEVMAVSEPARHGVGSALVQSDNPIVKTKK